MIKLYYSDELYHHGIEGQKWGVRNGPPYPLNRRRQRRMAAQSIKRRNYERIERYNRLSGSESNSEVKDILDRMRMDQQMDELVDKDLSASRRRIRMAIATAGATAGSIAAIYGLYKTLGGTPVDLTSMVNYLYTNGSAVLGHSAISDELYHHGIEGQKWGVRNGPPYPLDRSTSNRIKSYGERANKYYKSKARVPLHIFRLNFPLLSLRLERYGLDRDLRRTYNMSLSEVLSQNPEFSSFEESNTRIGNTATLDKVLIGLGVASAAAATIANIRLNSY